MRGVSNFNDQSQIKSDGFTNCPMMMLQQKVRAMTTENFDSSIFESKQVTFVNHPSEDCLSLPLMLSSERF